MNKLQKTRERNMPRGEVIRILFNILQIGNTVGLYSLVLDEALSEFQNELLIGPKS